MSILKEAVSDIWFDHVDLLDGDQYQNLLAVGTTQGHQVYCMDLNTFGPPAGLFGQVTMPFSDPPSSVKFLSSTKLLCAFQSHQTPVIVDLSAGTTSTLGTTDFGPNMRYNGMACNTALSQGVFVSQGAAAFTKVIAGVAALVSSLSWSSFALTCVIFNPNTNNYIFGTSQGKIVESTIAGVQISTFTLPASINDGSSSAPHNPDSMAINAAGTDLYITTDTGWLFHCAYPSGTVLEQTWLAPAVHSSSANVVPNMSLGSIVNGFMPITFVSTSNRKQPSAMLIYDVSQNPMCEVDRYFVDDLNKVVFAGLNASTSQAFVGWDAGRVTVLNCPGTNSSTEPTLIQRPAGLNVTGRIIRLVNLDYQLWRVELDTPIASGPTTLPARVKGSDYLEVGLNGTPYSTENADARLFQA